MYVTPLQKKQFLIHDLETIKTGKLTTKHSSEKINN